MISVLVLKQFSQQFLGTAQKLSKKTDIARKSLTSMAKFWPSDYFIMKINPLA
jgi:hypothetical protein